jgi:hypothetical protein
MKFILLPLLLLLLISEASGQSENALPPGPSRIFGTVVNQKGVAIEGATVTVIYPGEAIQSINIFRTSEHGAFTAYVHKPEQYVDLEIRVGKKLKKRIRYHQPGIGNNIGSPYERIVIKHKGF